MQQFSQRLHARIVSQLVSRRGQTLVEYSLILAIIGVVFIAVFRMLSNQIIITFSAITTLLDSPPASTF